MRNKHVCFVLFAITLSIARVGFAQVKQEWVTRHSGPKNQAFAQTIGVDATGNVYVTGSECLPTFVGNGNCDSDWATIKYDSAGNELWVARFDGPAYFADSPSALALDSAGNVYVTGSICVIAITDELGGYCGDSDYATIKYDTHGNPLWVARYGSGPGESGDSARAITVDAAGNVYVTGESYADGGTSDYATIKYDSNGNELWVVRYNGPGNDLDVATAIALDSAGNVYVTGLSDGTGSRDYATIKYDPHGNQVWAARYGPGAGSAIVVDAGNVYVTGFGNGDYATIKYDVDGNERWVARYNGPGNGLDMAEALAVDAAGNVYVTGGSLGAGTRWDYATIKYDADGNERWVTRYNGPGNSDDFAQTLAADAAGNVYATGRSRGAGTGFDYATIKYDVDGNERWITRYNGPGNGDDSAWALAADAAGNIYVTGTVSLGADKFNYATIKYSQTGLDTVQVTVQTAPAGLQITVDGTMFTAPQNFSWSPGTNHTIATTTPQGADGTRDVFANWSDGGAVSHSVAPTINTTYTANFTTQYLLTTVVSPFGGSVVRSPTSADGFYDAGTTVQLTAVADPGNVFSFWSGDLTVTTNPQSVLMTAVKSVTANFTSLSGLRFVPVIPCRVADTRDSVGPFGGPAIAGSATRDFAIPASGCDIPSTALAYVLNVTVVPSGTLGHLSIWPAGQPQPPVSTLNSLDGRIKANAAIVVAGTSGAVSVFVTDTTHVILDISGYFAPPATAPTGLAFYPVTPCRVADTRNSDGPLGGPILTGLSIRTFPILSSSCGIPATAAAYSLNMTVVPNGSLGFLTTWASGTAQPLVSTLNDGPGTIVANAAIVPKGSGGSIDVFVTDQTHLVIDVNGYFAPPGAGGLLFYALAPCRVVDTRNPIGPFGGPALSSARVFDIGAGACVVPPTAEAYSFNATVVPPGPLGHLTLGPAGQPQPLVSTLNSLDAAIASNAAIVPTIGGTISAFSSDTTHLILDLNGFFAP